MKEHLHKCECCGRDFHCEGVGKGKVCEVVKAAKVNKRGPYCEMCRCGIMFRRYCQNNRVEILHHLARIAEHDDKEKLMHPCL